MQNVDVLVREELNKDLQREAANERLVREVREEKSSNMLNNARKAFGQGLVQVGQQMLNER